MIKMSNTEKKDFYPKDIHELEKIYYDKRYVGRKRRYESWRDSDIIDKLRENDANKILEKFGISYEISGEKLQKTADYAIEGSKIVYEITSIQISDEEKITQLIKRRYEEDFIKKINRAIRHASRKQYSKYPDYIKGAVIFIDKNLTLLTEYNKYLTNASLVKRTIFTESDMDFMILAPMPPLPSSTNKELAYRAYAKDDKLHKMFEEKLPKEYKVLKL